VTSDPATYPRPATPLGPRRLARPIREFLEREAAGGVVLALAALVALIVANSPLGPAYERFWSTEAGFSIGDLHLEHDLRHWVNDGLMTIFFFVVGLEIKRELVVGELNEWRKASLPAIAALGGMIVPALIYVGINLGGDNVHGWGIPMATDIAFAVGFLSLFGSRAPAGLKVFILSLAIVDDIGAILVIALFYSGGIETGWLAAAGVAVVVVMTMRRLRIWWIPAYVLVGVFLWFVTFESGVHATIAGVVLGLLTPTRPVDPKGVEDVVDNARALRADPDPAVLRSATAQAQEVVSVAERLEHGLHPWTSFLVIPLFALANAGVNLGGGALREALASRVGLGIVLGLVVGKLVGITMFSWVGVKTGLGSLPDGVGWSHTLAAAGIAGIGFTVSLFIADLAFPAGPVASTAKVAILIASGLAAAAGGVMLSMSRATDDADARPGAA